MQTKVIKWSKRLKWVILIALIWRVILVGVYLPQMFSNDTWTDTAVLQEISEDINQWIDTSESNIVLKEEALVEYKELMVNFYAMRLTQEIMVIALLTIGYILMTKLARGQIFNKGVYKLIQLTGSIIVIGSMLISTIGNVETGIELLAFTDHIGIHLDLYMLIVGLTIMIAAYILKYAKFLQDEYDMTL